MTVRIFEVGGSIRDKVLGVDNNDRDFCAEGSWEDILSWCNTHMDKIFQIKEEFFTVRGKIGKEAIDIVMCRKEFGHSDGRHPDLCEQGTLLEDLSRRDFTINAMAIEVDHNLNQIGEIIDPFNGQKDLANGVLRFVGNAEERLNEDKLRLLRAFRFTVCQKGWPSENIRSLIKDSKNWDQIIKTVSKERIREEISKCLKKNMVMTFQVASMFDFNFPLFLENAGITLKADIKK